MRNNATDNYNTISLIGNNSYSICFMNYLFSIQGVEVLYSNKYKIHDDFKDNILKNIAAYFGTQGPVLIDNEGLLKLFSKYQILSNSDEPIFNSIDIINQLEMCLKSDFVYVCNYNGELDKYTMFMLGFLMAKNVELCFWNEIDDSEWLMSCMTSNKRTIGEVVQYPLEIIRCLAYPYLFQKLKSDLKPGKYGKLIIDENGKYGVDTKSDFDLNVCNQIENENTVSILGSLRKQLNSIYENSIRLQKNGYKVLAPKISSIRCDEKVTKKEILDVLDKFQGLIEQEVPKYSAVKVNGKKLYKYARNNIEVKLPIKEVNIYKLELLDYNENNMEVTISCNVNKGTYIRSLIKDIG